MSAGIPAQERPIATEPTATKSLEKEQPALAVTTPAVPQPNHEKLTIVWTSGDPEVAHRMVLMYAKAAKANQWFDEVQLIVWGPSARLVAADKDIQAKLKEMKQLGIVVEACVVCADSYGVSDRLRELGIDVKPMGKPLTNIIREKSSHLITF
ncbi:MAG: DsrE family protein [Pirellulaceae bacterium]|nr:DsrE family protein [Pirellulaceae bacterium]